MKNLLIAATLATVALSGFAMDNLPIEKSVALKDGSTVYVFKDGKMAMESPYGRAVYMNLNEVMTTKDGQTLVMNGNEVGALQQAIYRHNRR